MTENKFEFSTHSGAEVGAEVDALNLKYGKNARARSTDIYFVVRLKSEIVGCVRFCVEENTALLRSMLIDEKYRQQKLGHKLLSRFEKYLIENQVQETFCLPYPHLEKFYGAIGFKKITKSIPPFLQERILQYGKIGTNVICMKRT